ncbi:MAG TPA: extracellular solute-binding protein [Pirellulaceae bacterium]|nr:extracellular solute-binding protein [Pirellulaceae bacterium]
MSSRLFYLVAVLSPLPLLCAGCGRENEIVVYAALDREFSAPILEDFERESGIVVRPKYDVESTKTVGLASAILAEKNRPRCDVFWNNEILHTLRLEKAGVLEVYRSKAAADFPSAYVSPRGTWHGLAARARVLIVNTQLVPEDQRPRSIEDLADPKWKGKIGMAKPLFGTTATHAAVLFAHWGDEKAKSFFQRLKENDIKILSGNKQVALDVGSGALAFGLTDTDDSIIERDHGSPVAIVFPDQGDGQIGTLFIPNTLAITKGAPHLDQARKLVDFLLAPAVEEQLAKGESAQFPVNPAVKTPSRAAPKETVIKWMEADFSAAADKWESASGYIENEFLR